jgi:hypothetical protein
MRDLSSAPVLTAWHLARSSATRKLCVYARFDGHAIVSPGAFAPAAVVEIAATWARTAGDLLALRNRPQ